MATVNGASGRFKFLGFADVSGKVRQIRMEHPTKAAKAQMRETEVEATSCRRATPVKSGLLRSTVRAEGPWFEGDRIITAVSAGSAAADYALPVHENLEAKHRTGGAKFIEATLKASSPHMADRIAARLKL